MTAKLMTRRLGVVIGFIVSVTPASAQIVQKQVRYIMGTLCEIKLYSGGDGQAAMDAAFGELNRIDAMLSNWKADSDLMKLNRAADVPGESRPWISVTPELFERIQVALRVAEATDGRFDPTVGPLVRAYGFLPSVADRAPISAVRLRVGWRKVELDPVLPAVRFAVPGMEIDLGGIAKGYAAHRAAEILRQQGITAALVSLGGSSLAAVGTPPGKAAWHLLIRDPRDGATPAGTVDLRDGESLATSGTYENAKGQGKARRSHIIDPRSGHAIAGSIGVTVLYPDAEIADALTKPFFLEPCCSAADWAKWLASFENAGVILLQARRGELKRITGGAYPERFGPAPTDSDGHAAKTNRRSAEHLPRDGEGSTGHFAYSSEARRLEAHGPAGHDPAHFPRNPGTSVH